MKRVSTTFDEKTTLDEFFDGMAKFASTYVTEIAEELMESAETLYENKAIVKQVVAYKSLREKEEKYTMQSMILKAKGESNDPAKGLAEIYRNERIHLQSVLYMTLVDNEE